MPHVQNQYLVLSLSSAIITHALSLHETYRLRAYDSIQLASALELNIRLAAANQTLTFIATDVRLLQSAASAGLQTDNPNNYP
jgi:predicted nucleic acid-binding protein